MVCELTHGITREIKLDLILQGTNTDPWGNERAGAEIQGFLSRQEFDMKFNQALGSGNLLVGDKVRIALDISAILKIADGIRFAPRDRQSCRWSVQRS